MEYLIVAGIIVGACFLFLVPIINKVKQVESYDEESWKTAKVENTNKAE